MRWASGKYVRRCGWGSVLALLLSFSTLAQSPVSIDSVALLNEFGLRQTFRPTGNALRLPARQNYLTLRLRATPPQPVQYRLAGVDEQWHRGHSADRIHYVGLAGGTYQFQVKPIGQPEGVPPDVDLRIDVAAPFWAQWWFGPVVVLYVMGVLGVVSYLFLQYRFRQRLHQFLVRDRLARDLHDDMGSYLSSISILSQTLTTDPDRLRRNLDRISQTTQVVMDSMSDIVWSVDPTRDTLADLLLRIRETANELFADQEDTAVTFPDLPPDLARLPLETETRRHLLLIAKESLTNARRYAHATRLDVALRREGTDVVLSIADNGRGFNPDAPGARPGGGNGLRNLRARAEQMSAVVDVASQPEQGTTVTVRWTA